MNIAFDATALLADFSRDEETGNFVLDWIGSVLEQYTENQYFCFNMYDRALDTDWELKYSNFREICFYSGIGIEILRMPEYKNVLGKMIVDFLEEYDIDVFCITSPFDPVLTVYEKEWFERTKTVAVVCDVKKFIDKDLYFISRSIQRKSDEQLHMLAWVDACFARSDDVADEIVQITQHFSKKVHVIKDREAMSVFFDGRQAASTERKKREKKAKRIAFFTPLPPSESGIAYYSYHILNEISRYVDVDVYVDNGDKRECSLPLNVKVYGHYEFIDHVHEYDKIVYQVGNNKYHSYIFDYIREFPGIVDLHDYSLHGILNQLYGVRAGQKFAAYKKALLEDMTEEDTRNYICRRLSHYTSGNVLENEFNGFIVNYAQKVIVHNHYAERKLLEKDIMRNVEVIPLYAKLYPAPIEVKKTPPVVFAAFGFVQPSKRVVPILKAFEKIAAKGYDVKLLFVGKVNESVERTFDLYCSKENLRGRISATGYVTEEEFENYMLETNVGLSLRYPYMGETSGPLVRLMGMGKCVIVNDIGSFSEVPDDSCIKIPSVERMEKAEEVGRIYEAMKRALKYEERKAIGINAYNYVKNELDIHMIGEKYIDAINHTDRKPFTNEELRQLLRQDRLLDKKLWN